MRQRERRERLPASSEAFLQNRPPPHLGREAAASSGVASPAQSALVQEDAGAVVVERRQAVAQRVLAERESRGEPGSEALARLRASVEPEDIVDEVKPAGGTTEMHDNMRVSEGDERPDDWDGRSEQAMKTTSDTVRTAELSVASAQERGVTRRETGTGAVEPGPLQGEDSSSASIATEGKDKPREGEAESSAWFASPSLSPKPRRAVARGARPAPPHRDGTARAPGTCIPTFLSPKLTKTCRREQRCHTQLPGAQLPPLAAACRGAVQTLPLC